MNEVRVLTQNVQRYPLMTFDEVKQDVSQALDWADVIGFQEIERPYVTQLSRMLANRRWEMILPQPAHGTPLAWDTRVWEMRVANWFTLHEVNERTSIRECTFAILKHKESHHGVLFNNAHYIPPGNRPAYLKIWQEGNERHRNKLKLAWMPRGIPIIGTGDFNRTGPVMGTKVGNFAISYPFQGEHIDHIWKVNGKTATLKQQEIAVLNQNSDHKGYGAVYTIQNKRIP